MTAAASETRAVRPFFVGQYPCRIVVRRHGPQWIAVAELTMPEGPVRFAASADEDVIARRLADHVAVAGFDLGRVFGQVAQGARQLAQARSVRDVMQTVSNVTREPVVHQALSFIPGVGPVAGPALRAATTLLDRSERGDPRALSNLGAITSAAHQGHPLAGQAMQVLAEMFRSQQRTSSARFRARQGAPGGPPRAPSYTAPSRPSSRPQQSADLGNILGSLLGVASSVASAASSGPLGDASPSTPAATASGDADWRAARPEERTPAQHRSAYQAAITTGLGDAYREAATVGAWEGARWLWNEVRPQPFRAEGWTPRGSYAEGLRVMAEREALRLAR